MGDKKCNIGAQLLGILQRSEVIFVCDNCHVGGIAGSGVFTPVEIVIS